MLSLFDQFNGFAKGVIELYALTYFIFFTTFFRPDDVLDGGTQVDRKEVNAAPRRHGLWLNWLIVIYTAVALAALFGIANLIIFDHNIRWD